MATVEKTLSDQYTSNIGQRLFAYTYHSNVINSDIANQFKKSLIFLGYEGQIWSPLTNTYVGIGKTAYDITTAYTVLAHEKIDALNTALTSSLVSGIYANWGEDDWATAQGINAGLPEITGDNAWNTKIGASNKIVLKGIGDYDIANDQRMDGEYAHVTDRNATPGEQTALSNAKIPFTTYSQWATSGITVSLEKGENEYRWERLAQNAENGVENGAEAGENGKVVAWIKGKDAPAPAGGFTWDSSTTNVPAQPMSTTHYVRVFNAKNEQVYRNGKNVISIDDKQTWSYITARTSYAMDFAKEYTNSEVNRIYTEILGLQQGQVIPVSYNHIWEVAANVNAENNKDGDSYVPVALPTDKIYLQKVAITNSTGLAYNTTYQTIEVPNLGTVNSIDTLIRNWEDIRKAGGDYYVMGLDKRMGEFKDFITDNLTHVNGNIDNQAGINKENKQTLYNLDHVYKVVFNIADVKANEQYVLVNQTYTSVADNINLADGINTLKEVAYVLDLITNGSIMDPTNPENAGIELAYSIAQNHVEIVELDKRLDNLEAGKNAVRSLREVVNGQHLDLHLASAVNDGDKYYQDVTISATLNMAYTHSAADTVARETVFVPTWNADETSGDITLSYTVDGTTTVHTLVDRTHDGLVTTKWALSYGVELRQAIVANDIELNKHLAYAHSYALINALDGTYTTSNSKLVCGYTQTNGAVSVSYRELPTDHIQASATVWGESGDTALKVYETVIDNKVSELVALQTPLFALDTNKEYLKLKDDECGAVTDTSVVNFFALKDGVMVPITTENFGGQPSDLTKRVQGLTRFDHIVAYKQINKYVRVDSADLVIDAAGKAEGAQLYTLATSGQPTAQVKYISATAVHHNDESDRDNDGSNTFHVTAHITKISDATASNSGLADAYDVRNAIDNIFGWVDLSEWTSNNPLNRTNTPQA